MQQVVSLGNATGSRPIFSFNNIPQIQWNQVVSSRYTTENVDISLGSAIPFSGVVVTPAR